MNKLTLRTENQWRYVRDGGGIDLLRIPVSVNRWHVSAGVTLLGFGVGLTWWLRKPVKASPWAAAGGAAASMYGLTPAEGWTDGTPFAPASYAFYADPWPEGVPVESPGREHGA